MSDVSAVSFILIALAAYRLAYMLVHEAGPFAVFYRLRERIGAGRLACAQQHADNLIRNPFCCVACMSVWTSALCVLLYAIEPSLVLWLGIAGAVLVVMDLTG